MERSNSTRQGHGTSWASPKKLKEQLLKAILLLECLTLGSGPSLLVSATKDLVHNQANGRALAKPHPISLATSTFSIFSFFATIILSATCATSRDTYRIILMQLNKKCNDMQ